MSTKPFPALTRVIAGDGTALPGFDAGPRDAPALVLVHGISQSKAIWTSLLTGPLAQTHRLLAFDLRGHGDAAEPASDEPLTRARLGADLGEVLTALRLHRPTVLVWSFGGVVLGEYLRRQGDADLGGIVHVAAAVRTGREASELYGPAMLEHARGLLAQDTAVYAAAARAFFLESSAHPLPPAVVDATVADMVRVAAPVRRALLAGGEDYRPELRRTTVPIATLHGECDPVVLPAMSDLVSTLRPDARSARFAGVGHLPWLEAPPVFLDALRAVLA